MSGAPPKKADTRHHTALGAGIGLLIFGAALVGLYLLSRANYLLFHAIVESFSIIIACGVFMIAWNARRFQANGFFLCLGIASLFVAGVDFLHTLAYKNMGVFPAAGPNLPTQLWIAARYLQAVSLLLAPLFLSRLPRPTRLFGGWLTITVLLLAAIFGGIFPDCFREGAGLSPFKVASEYLICLMLAGSLLLLHGRRKFLDSGVLRLLSLALGAFIAAELSFTLYTDVFGFSNMAGHLFKVGGFYLIYRGVIETGLTRPYDLLFRELKEREERYRNLYKKTPVMLHSIDCDGRLVSVSEHWLEHLGYMREEVIGRHFTEFLSEESRRRALETVFPEFFRSGTIRDIPYQVRKTNGEVIDALLSAVAERDEKGDVVRSLAVMVDVTERKRSQEEIERLNAELLTRAAELEAANTELEAANEELGAANRELEVANADLEAFNYSVSHDLRAPLTHICGNAQVILGLIPEQASPQALEIIRGILDQGWRMNDLINTLLEFSRLGKVEIRRGMVDFTAMARGITAGFALRTPDRPAVFAIAEGVKAEGDAGLLQAVLENLLGNAWKYTGKNAEAFIEFGTDEIEGTRAFFVRDNGTGFDMTSAADLFTPFKRFHAREEFEGFGIGLATVQRVISRHGGRVWAESRPGEGSTFYFTLGGGEA